MTPLTLLAALAIAAPAAEPLTAARWLWVDERPQVEGAGQTRYFRLTLDLADTPTAALVNVLADDGLGLWLNGAPLDDPVALGGIWQRFDVAARLVEGRNVLAAAVFNAGGAGGLIVRGELGFADGQRQTVVSDETWRASTTAPNDWQGVDFDDTAWPAAHEQGDATMPPWYRLPPFDLDPFIGPQEATAVAARHATLTAVPDSVASESIWPAQIGYEAGHPALFIGGQPRPALLYRPVLDPLSEYGRSQIALFRDAGCHVYAVGYDLADAWRDPEKLDFGRLDDVVRAYLSVDPQAQLVLIVSLNPPPWWLAAYPEELTGYATGPADTNEESHRVPRPSFASPRWWQEMGTAWRAAISHLEAQPWGRRVIGYQPGFGIYTEWHYWGSWTLATPDTGPAMTSYFRTWLQGEYGGDEAALAAAYGRPGLTFGAVEVPGVAPREVADALGLRDPVAQDDSRWVRDYYRCQQELTAQRIRELCQQAEVATRGRALTGVFYGYWQEVHPQTQGGHLEVEALLADGPDYMAAPYDYQHRQMGNDGRQRAALAAFPAAGRVHVIESDLRTYLHPLDEFGRQPDLAASLAAMRREVGSALAGGAGLWWCDFGPPTGLGWYDDPELRAELGRLYALAARRLEQAEPRRSVAEVALLIDPRSMYDVADGAAMNAHLALTERVITALERMGTPYDMLMFDQMPADGGQYRLAIVLDAYRVASERYTAWQRWAPEVTTVWLGPAGWTGTGPAGDLRGPAAVRALTGLDVAVPAGPGALLGLTIVGADAGDVLARDAAGGVVAARGPAGAVLVADGELPAQLLAPLYARAGVHRWMEDERVRLRADSGLVMLHTADAGRYTLRLPRPARVVDALGGEELGAGSEVAVDLQGPDTRLLTVTEPAHPEG